MPYSDHQLPEVTLKSMFYLLRAQIGVSGPAPKSDIHPGQADVYYTIIGPQVDDKVKNAIDQGNNLLYALDMRRYRDNVVPPNKFIYTESCIYFLRSAIHLCESGHNKSYISD
jgi:hypothetical protein